MMDTTLVLLPLSDIDEDPNQPRTEFDENSLNELAETIRTRGVKTPISVRPNPTDPGRYTINHGARRFRASLLAGKTTIPAHVDTEYTEEDQLIENIQREGLNPREVAEFIGKLLAKGKKKGEIAKIIGKSPAYVTQHLNLLDLPGPVNVVFSSGRCTDVTIINELTRLQKSHPEQTQTWLSDTSQDINRGAVKLFKDFLESVPPNDCGTIPPPKSEQVAACPARKNEKRRKQPNLSIRVEVEGEPATLQLEKLPDRSDSGWFLSSDGTEFEAPLAKVKLVALYHN